MKWYKNEALSNKFVTKSYKCKFDVINLQYGNILFHSLIKKNKTIIKSRCYMKNVIMEYRTFTILHVKKKALSRKEQFNILRSSIA